jgi:hypothetical protein
MVVLMRMFGDEKPLKGELFNLKGRADPMTYDRIVGRFSGGLRLV